VVTDKNGCTNSSNTILLYEYCGDGYGSGRCNNEPCVSNDSIGFKYSNLGFCNEIRFENTSTSGHMVGSLIYYFETPDGEQNTIMPNFDYTFTQAGYYEVILLGEVPDLNSPGDYCTDFHVEIVKVPVAANFFAFPGCVDEEISFENTSTFLTGSSIASYAWDFDDSSGANNASTDENPTHTYSAPGIYEVSLTITADDGCISRITHEVEVLPEMIPDFDISTSTCIDQGILFEAITDVNIAKYTWIIEDPTSSSGQTNRVGENMIHTFDTPGTFDVTLETLDIFGCTASFTKSVLVSAQDLTGDIAITPGQDICSGELATLTAPSGGIAYLWSTGESTPTIEVGTAGEYEVTVTNSNGCEYIPDPTFVNVLVGPEMIIRGHTYPEGSGWDGIRHFERMEVCIDEDFEISRRWNSSYDFTWSIGGTGTYLSKSDLVALGIGEHTITLEASKNNSSCIYTSEPFTLVIHDLPSVVQIASNLPDLCEGNLHTLSVISPDPQLKYYWNNGRVGTQITTSSSGSYYVTAVNDLGCSRNSNYVHIQNKPEVE